MRALADAHRIGSRPPEEHPHRQAGRRRGAASRRGASPRGGHPGGRRARRGARLARVARTRRRQGAARGHARARLGRRSASGWTRKSRYGPGRATSWSSCAVRGVQADDGAARLARRQRRRSHGDAGGLRAHRRPHGRRGGRRGRDVGARPEGPRGALRRPGRARARRASPPRPRRACRRALRAERAASRPDRGRRPRGGRRLPACTRRSTQSDAPREPRPRPQADGARGGSPSSRTDGSSPRPSSGARPCPRRQEHASVSASSRPSSRSQGPTGVGKSLLFNALSGAELATVGRRRPTTSEGQAAVVGRRRRSAARLARDPAAPPARRRRPRRPRAPRPAGLRLRRDRAPARGRPGRRARRPRRLGRRAAEVRGRGAARPLPAAAADARGGDGGRPEPGRPSVSGRDRRLARGRLAASGERRPAPRCPCSSSRRGRARGSTRCAGCSPSGSRRATRQSLGSRRTSTAVADALREWCGDGKPAGIQRADRERLVAALEEAGGVPRVVRAVDAAHRHRGALATGWPFVRWVRRLRPDPLRRLRLRDRAPEGAPESGRSSLPPPTRGAACPGCDGDSQSRRPRGRRPAGTVAHARPRRSHGE